MAAKNFIPFTENSRDPATLTLGGIVREERLRHGWSPATLAQLSGIRRQTVDAIEKGKNRPRVDTERRLERAFQIPAGTLLARADRRATRWLNRCARCNYFCISANQLKWLDWQRGCIRPKN